MNHATQPFFKTGTGVVLAVYDTRRGQVEGREAEKILAFYPPTATAAMQSSIVGLAQALTMFAGTFNKVSGLTTPYASRLFSQLPSCLPIFHSCRVPVETERCSMQSVCLCGSSSITPSHVLMEPVTGSGC